MASSCVCLMNGWDPRALSFPAELWGATDLNVLCTEPPHLEDVHRGCLAAPAGPCSPGEGVETQRMDAKQTEICTCGCKANRNMHRCWCQSPCLVLYCVFSGCLISDGIKVPKTPCLAKMQTNSLRSFREGCLVLHWTFSSYLQSLEFCFPPDKLCAFWQTSTKCCEM